MRSGRAWVWAWIAGVVVTLAIAGVPAVRRTQEARVLVGAREMLGATSLRDWLVPHVNGQLRLQKPPLAYWTSAAAFKLFGVNEWAGRAPAVLAGWGTIALAFAIARRQFGVRAAVLAAGILAGCQLACRSSMLAETDAPAAFFVTAAVAALWRGCEEGAARRRSAGWFHLASVAMAGAAMSKGPPAFFPLLFLVGWAVAFRTARPLARWVVCGAPLTFAVLALPWWLYVNLTVNRAVLRAEVSDLVSGRDHGANPLAYVPMLIAALAPWTAVTAVAVWEAVRRCRRDRRLRVVVVWALSVIVPLCFVGNKQPHYLLPLLAPLAVITGWFADRVLRRARTLKSAIGPALLNLTAVASLFVIAAVVIVATGLERGRLNPMTIGVAVATLVGGGAVVAVQRSRGWPAAVVLFTLLTVPAMSALSGLWAPSLEVSDSRSLAADIDRRFPGRPLCFAGDGAYLPVCFTLKRVVPFHREPADLERAAERQPELVALQQTPQGHHPTKYPSLPPPFVRAGEIGAAAEHLDAYVVPSAGGKP